MKNTQILQKATFANGCFWCTEAVFQQLKGVTEVLPGYIGGTTKNPTYEEVSTGLTGHAEALQITFDPNVISYETLLEVFWQTHDPTTLNQQGNDVGTQYRSAIFYHDETQKRLAEESKKKLTDQKVYDNPVVTEIIAAPQFYEAEEYHRNYFLNHPEQAYCSVVINPKVQKFRQKYTQLLKEDTALPAE